MPDEPEESTRSHPSAQLRAVDDEGHKVDAAPREFPTQLTLPYDRVSYGPSIPDEGTFRLIGNVEGKRVLDLGSWAGHTAIALATKGAHVISVDPSAEHLEDVRSACDTREAKVELHQSDLAELAFVRADTIDVVVSVYALASVADLDRVFRQVHRVLRTGGPFIFSLPHPTYSIIDPGDDPRRIARRYFDRTTPDGQGATTGDGRIHRTISEIFAGLMRANFRIDALLEPEPDPSRHDEAWTETMSWIPPTLVVRARKEGI